MSRWEKIWRAAIFGNNTVAAFICKSPDCHLSLTLVISNPQFYLTCLSARSRPPLLLLLSILTLTLTWGEKEEAWISFQRFPSPSSSKSPAIREVLQQRLMGDYTGVELRFADLDSPPSSSLFSGTSVSEFLIISALYFHESLCGAVGCDLCSDCDCVHLIPFFGFQAHFTWCVLFNIWWADKTVLY